MASKESSETSEPTMNTLREAFYTSCKIWGLTQKSCLGLTLLLNSRWQLAQILLWGLEMEKKKIEVGTTEVVLKAEEIHEYYLERLEAVKLEK